jgi:opacity protein-like surface antigen
MQKTIVAALALIASTAVASATDLPSKSTPAAPIAPVSSSSQSYFGVNGGWDVKSDRAYSVGAVAGWNVLPILAVEGTYDLSRADQKVRGDWNYGNTIAVNAVPQYKVPGIGITAYAIGGVGYKWNTEAADYAVYNVGGGLKYELSKSLDFDGRYRRIEAIDSKKGAPEDRVTAGVNYKF